ncbi:hypothetical protein O6Y00_04325 [Sphingomonas faeni]
MKMRMLSLSSGVPHADPVPSLLLRSGIAALLLCAVAAITIPRTVPNTLIDYYFFHQDLWLLGAGGLMLCILSRLDFGERPLAFGTSGARYLAGAIVLVALLAYAGSFVVTEHYALSRDEAMAEFAADYLQHGHLARAIPPGMNTLGDAMMPWAGGRTTNGIWLSGYLPINSLLRAGAGLLGDRFLAGPLLLGGGCAALWMSARKIWPDRPDAAIVAIVLVLTSTQVFATAMTPFAMTAHFALNAAWLVFYLRRDPIGHATAIAIGLLAAGLHQIQVHILFVTGFIVWDWVSGRRRTALLYAGACLGYLVVWDVLYARVLLNWALGPPTVLLKPGVPSNGLIQKFADRIGDLQPMSSLARFAAWQNILVLPLAFAGARGLHDDEGKPTIASAFAVSCMIGLVLMLYQGLGYGYRYLHGLIPCFCLLAAGGWIRLSAQRGRPMPAALLWAGCAFAVLFTAPLALTVSKAFLHPYAAAYRLLRTTPADIVLIDGRGGAFIEDLARVDGPIARPILLDMSYVPLRDLRHLCATRSVMVFDHVQARPLGIRPGGDAGKYARHIATGRALMERLHCGRPVPIG